ncbi:MAG: hypothetical protein ABIG84_04845 [archaeon]
MADAAMSGILKAIAEDHFERYLNRHIYGDNRGKEGKENHPHTVFLLAYNQPGIEDPYAILREDALDLISEEPYNPKTIKYEKEILDYLGGCGDGACALNIVGNSIAHVGEINNKPSSLPKDFDVYSLIPRDFVYYNGHTYNRDQIGMKTRAAVKAAAAAHNNGYEDFYAIITKETSYANDRVGMAALIGGNGLEEMYYLLSPEYEPKISEMQVRHRVYKDNGYVFDNPVDIGLSRLLGAMDKGYEIQFMPQLALVESGSVVISNQHELLT